MNAKGVDNIAQMHNYFLVSLTYLISVTRNLTEIILEL